MNKSVNDIEVLPEPPLPAETDVRSFSLMNVEKIKLRHMATRFEKKAEDFMAATRLLILSWDEQPSGSLPNDDAILCREAGVRPCHWAARKGSIMRDWFLCADGRYYSPLSVSGVTLAQASKTKGRKRQEQQAQAVGAAFYDALPHRERYLPGPAYRGTDNNEVGVSDDDDGIPF